MKFRSMKLRSMTLLLAICIFMAAAALAQSASQPPSLKTPAERGQATPSAPSLQTRDGHGVVPPDEPIITIQGLCPAVTAPANNSSVPSTKECITKITNEQFSNLLKAFNSNKQPLSVADQRRLAESYVDILVFAEAAKSAGVENSPNFAEVMRVLRLKTLADLYLTQLPEQSPAPTEQEIQEYYQANQEKYESAKLGRIYIPKNNPDPQATADQKQAYLKKVTSVVDDVQARAAKGEPAAALQKDAYNTLGIIANPPNNEMTVPRRGTLPPRLDQQVFSTKVGEVFRADDANGYLIIRMEKKETPPLDSIKEEITRDIGRARVDAKIKELKAPVHVTLDEKYFGPTATAPTLQQAVPPR